MFELTIRRLPQFKEPAKKERIYDTFYCAKQCKVVITFECVDEMVHLETLFCDTAYILLVYFT